VDLRDAVIVGAGGVAGSVFASQVALGVDGDLLSALFGGFAVLIAFRTLYRAFTAEPRPAQ
jgi:uncharacterized membrane protein YfcA